MNTNDEEYRQFLAMLHSGELAPADDPNDEDFDYQLSTNNGEFADVEEFRNDRAVQISKDELEALLHESELIEEQYQRHQAEVLRLQQLEEEQRVQQLDLERQIFIESLHKERMDANPTYKNLISSPSKKRKRNKSETRKEDGKQRTIFSVQHVDKLVPILPNIIKDEDTTTIPPVVVVPEEPKVFSPEQLQQLQNQLQNHFQLLVQCLLLAKHQTEPDPHIISNYWNLLDELQEASAASQDVNNEYNHGTTIYSGVHGLSLIPQFRTFYHSEFSKNPSYDALNNFMDRVQFNKYFQVDPNLLYTRPSSDVIIPNRLQFTPAEDKLLAIGLDRYGTRDWDSIQKQLLPGKSVKQLANRYKNMTNKKAPDDNPIKQYKIQIMNSLTEKEEQLLRTAVRIHGTGDWGIVSSKYLPHRQPSTLELLYRKITKANQPTETNNAPKPVKRKPKETDAYNFNENLLRDNSHRKQLHHLQLTDEPRHDNPPSVFQPSSPSSSQPSPQSHSDEDHQPATFTPTLLTQPAPSLTLLSDETLEPDADNSKEAPPAAQQPPTEEATQGASQPTSADNLTVLGGQVIVWSREQDREILTWVKRHGATKESWQKLSQSKFLQAQTPQQISARYKQLVALFKAQQKD